MSGYYSTIHSVLINTPRIEGLPPAMLFAGVTQILDRESALNRSKRILKRAAERAYRKAYAERQREANIRHGLTFDGKQRLRPWVRKVST